MIYMEKKYYDIWDDYQRSPQQNLNEFTLNWFYRQFANQQNSELIFKDFLTGIKQYYSQDLRFKLFSQMCGLFMINDNTWITIDQLEKKCIKLDVNFIINNLMCSNYIYNIFIRMTEYIKKDQLLQKNIVFTQKYQTFLPNICQDNGDMIHLDVAKNCIVQIMEEEDFPNDKIEEIIDNLPKLVQQDIYQKFLTKQFNQPQNMLDDRNYIRFDFFIYCIIEYIAENKAKDIFQFFTTLKIQYMSSGSIFEEFIEIFQKYLPTHLLSLGTKLYKEMIINVQGSSSNQQINQFLIKQVKLLTNPSKIEVMDTIKPEYVFSSNNPYISYLEQKLDFVTDLTDQTLDQNFQLNRRLPYKRNSYVQKGNDVRQKSISSRQSSISEMKQPQKKNIKGSRPSNISINKDLLDTEVKTPTPSRNKKNQGSMIKADTFIIQPQIPQQKILQDFKLNPFVYQNESRNLQKIRLKLKQDYLDQQDIISSIIVLQFSSQILQKQIKRGAQPDLQNFRLLKEFLHDLSKLPENAISLNNFDEIWKKQEFSTICSQVNKYWNNYKRLIINFQQYFK